jgi:nicotinate dehydrogenase subunit A
MAQVFSLTVNGKTTAVEASPEMPLLYALRNELGLSNPRFGCGLGQCGACTVHIDGEPVRSCVVPVSAVEGHITTLAGLGTADHPHPVQEAWIEEQVPQCGYCLSGWVMTAAAFLRRVENPTDGQIREALSTVKCRCGTHLAIIRAVKRAAKKMGAAA